MVLDLERILVPDLPAGKARESGGHQGGVRQACCVLKNSEGPGTLLNQNGERSLVSMGRKPMTFLKTASE